MTPPRVSAVIPTRGRAALVGRAVASVLAQTEAALEVVVVVDGPDEETVRVLAAIPDPRLRVVQNAQPQGGGGARNTGVEAARGEWVAFLDDDDEWLPAKLERQLAAAAASAHPRPVVACAFLARSSHGEEVWPRRRPRAGEAVGDYLFQRDGVFQGERYLPTITLMAPRALLREVPFAAELRRHQDWDWLLRALAAPGAGLEFVAEPLAVWHMAEQRASVSTTLDWRASLDWIQQSRDRVSRAAYSGFIATQVAPQAAAAGALSALPRLLRELVWVGRPRARDLMLFLGMWAVPGGARRRLRALAGRLRRS